MKRKMLRIACLSILSLVIIMTSVKAQKQVVIGETMSIKSEVLNEERFFSIYLPDNYKESTQLYPVIYVLDGRTHFHQVSGAVSFLSNMQSIPRMIVVAVHNVDRTRDFSPVPDENRPNTGGAEKFMNFVSGELIKHIDDNYRTSGFTVLIGHSFGGTFAAYALLEKPEVFDGYIAVSPYLHYVDSYLVKEAEKSLKAKYDSQKYFYMTVGDEPEYFEPLSKFSSLVEQKSKESIQFKYVKMKGETHATTPYMTGFYGLRFVFSDWQLPNEKLEAGLVAIDEHYKKVSVKYGFEVMTPENLINRLGYNYLQAGKVEKAIKTFSENVKRYPSSSNVYDSLGEAYENNNQNDLAEKNYKKAYELGKQQNHRNTTLYQTNLQRVQQK